MFIEVTTSGKKRLVNTDHIVSVGLFDWGDKKDPVLVFDSPLTPRGTNKMILDESYEQIKKMLS